MTTIYGLCDCQVAENGFVFECLRCERSRLIEEEEETMESLLFLHALRCDLDEAILEALLCAPFFVTDSFAS